MDCSDEVLLFLPSWYALNEEQLSDIITSIAQSSIVVVLVSINEDEIQKPYQHSRIHKSIIVKQVVMELLVLYQVTQLPFSIVVTKGSAKTGDGSTANFLAGDFLANDGSRNHNSRTLHRVPVLDSNSALLKATDLFALAVEAYDNFDFEAAAANFFKAIMIDNLYKSAYFNFAGLLHMVGYPTLAVHFMEQVLLLDKEDMIAHSFLWALTQLEETSNIGIETYKRLSAAGDIKAAHKLAALTGKGELAMKGDPKYARRIYDDMADKFEDKLVARLGYRGPWDLFEMLCGVIDNKKTEEEMISPKGSLELCDIENIENIAHTLESSRTTGNTDSSNNSRLIPSKYPKKGNWRILDLGCGSGLCGKVFCELVTMRKSDGDDPVDSGSKIQEEKKGEKKEEDEGGNEGEGGKGGGGGEEEEEEDLAQLSVLRHARESPGACMLGVDVSMSMVEITKRTGHYSCVARADLSDALQLFDQSTITAATTTTNTTAATAVAVYDTDYDGTDDRTAGAGDGDGEKPSTLSRDGIYGPSSDHVINIKEKNNNNNTNNITSQNKSEEKKNKNMNNFLEEHSENSLGMDLIIVADTFIYVGTLGKVFSQIKMALKSNGLFIFSIEDLDSSPMRVSAHTGSENTEMKNTEMKNTENNSSASVDKKSIEINCHICNENGVLIVRRGGEVVNIEDSEPLGAVPGWGAQLLKSARFAHSDSYIQILSQIHGFEVLKMRIVVLRTEETVPLHGRLYVLQAVHT